MGFITNLFRGPEQYTAQSGLQPGQLEQTYGQLQDAIKRQAEFAAAVSPGGVQGLAAQQDLSKQLASMAQGQGPSLAQPMLEQERQKQIAQTAALLGSQRGASQNVGLVGRTAARIGAETGMEAAGQAATLRASEQLRALQQLGELSGQQVAQQQAGAGMYGQSALQAQQQALDAQARQEQARTSMAAAKEGARADILGSTLGFAGKLAKGAEGGEASSIPKDKAPEFDIVEFLNAVKPMAHGEKVPGKPKVDGDSLKNDTVPALLSPGEIVVPRSAAKDPEKAAAFAKSVAMKSRKRKK